MPKKKDSQTSSGPQAKRTRRASRRVLSLPVAGEDVSLETVTFSPRSFYDSELDKLRDAHSRGLGRKFPDDSRIKTGLRKRAAARGWTLDFVHCDWEGQPVLIVRVAHMPDRAPHIQLENPIQAMTGITEPMRGVPIRNLADDLEPVGVAGV